jgi:hypothetical protein
MKLPFGCLHFEILRVSYVSSQNDRSCALTHFIRKKLEFTVYNLYLNIMVQITILPLNRTHLSVYKLGQFCPRLRLQFLFIIGENLRFTVHNLHLNITVQITILSLNRTHLWVAFWFIHNKKFNVTIRFINFYQQTIILKWV